MSPPPRSESLGRAPSGTIVAGGGSRAGAARVAAPRLLLCCGLELAPRARRKGDGGLGDTGLVSSAMKIRHSIARGFGGFQRDAASPISDHALIALIAPGTSLREKEIRASRP